MQVIRPKPPFRQAALRFALALVCCFGLLISMSVHAYAEDDQPSGDTELATDAAPSDPTEAPPPVVEEPTEAPVVEEPTDVPTLEPVPEEPTIAPTEIPGEEPTALPTDEPVATATEAPSATPTESPTPSPTPTTVPAIPFDPTLDCKRIEGGVSAIAGDPGRGWLDCTLRWETAHVQKLQVAAAAQSAGWNVIVVERDALNDQVKLAAGTNKLDLTDSNPDDADFLTAHLYIGSLLGCTSPTASDIKLTFTATSDGPKTEEASENVVEAVTKTVAETGSYPVAPSVSLTSVSFTPIANSLTGSRETAGSINFTFSNAPATCGWSTTITFADFVSGDMVIPAANLVALQSHGDDALVLGSDGGAITLTSPPSDRPGAADGLVSVDISLSLGTFMPQGNYQTTVTIEALANA
jgi:hypothetical protein